VPDEDDLRGHQNGNQWSPVLLARPVKAGGGLSSINDLEAAKGPDGQLTIPRLVKPDLVNRRDDAVSLLARADEVIE
jgi:hypothetical protein